MENFDEMKADLQSIEEIGAIKENPVVTSFVNLFRQIPYFGDLACDSIDKAFEAFQKEKRERFYEYIITSQELITLENVNDITILMEFAKTLDVVNRLATNDKVKYIAMLFSKTFSNQFYRTHISEYEEYLRRLEYISCRELDLLFLLYDCERSPDIYLKKSLNKIDEAWNMFKKKASEEYGIVDAMIVSLISGLTMTGFCREVHFMRPGTGPIESPFCTTEYFWRFLELIT